MRGSGAQWRVAPVEGGRRGPATVFLVAVHKTEPRPLERWHFPPPPPANVIHSDVLLSSASCTIRGGCTKTTSGSGTPRWKFVNDREILPRLKKFSLVLPSGRKFRVKSVRARFALFSLLFFSPFSFHLFKDFHRRFAAVLLVSNEIVRVREFFFLFFFLSFIFSSSFSNR